MQAGLIAFLVTIAVIAVLLRRQHRSPALTAIAASVVAYPVGLLIAGAVQGSVGFWAFSAGYWFPTLCLLMVLGAVYKSLSLRMLLDLYESPRRASTLDDIFARYISETSFSNRIEVIKESRFADCVSDGLALTPKGRRIAAAAAALQRAFAIERSG